MNNPINIIGIARRISSILLLISVAMQGFIIVLLATDFDQLEIDEIHEISGYILLGLMLIHIALYWRNLKSLFVFKRKAL